MICGGRLPSSFIGVLTYPYFANTILDASYLQHSPLQRMRGENDDDGTF